MQVKYDYFNMPVDPKLYICNSTNKPLAPIVRYTDSTGKNTLKLTVNYNRTSELSIQIYKFIEDTLHRQPLTDSAISECYQYIKNYRQIHVEGLGYFLITNTTENDGGFDPYKEIKCTSCEIELNGKGIDLAAGTYQFWNATTPNITILGKILNLCPTWSIGNISPSVAALYRTFDDLSKTVYSFMMNDIENAFSCICDFDIENRKINIIDMVTEIPSTDILLTYDNALNSVKIDQPAENIITALNVSGGSTSNETLDIRNANPIGGNVIYNFTNFMNTDDMDQSLIDAINAWNTKVSNNQTVFTNLVLQIQTAEAEYANLDGQLADLKTALLSLQQAETVATTANRPAAKAAVDAKQIEVNNKQVEVNNKTAQITTLTTQLTTLQSSLSMIYNFTTEQYITLTTFIHQSDYKDENIVITPSMTYGQKQEQVQMLYNKAIFLLNQRCVPTSTIEIECQNFVLMSEFATFRDQLELGSLIHVELTRGNIIDMMLLQYEIDYDEKSLKIAVSNRVKLHDEIKDVQDWQTQLATSANTMTTNKDDWNYGVKSGLLDYLDAASKAALNLTNNPIIIADGQHAVFDATGYHGFRIDPTTGAYSPKQMELTNNVLRFTTDNWVTTKAAFGEFTLSNGTVVYGLNADTIVAGTIDAGTINVENINATNITTGEFNADLIKTGRIESSNGDYSLDMEIGEVIMKRGTFSGDISWTDTSGTEIGSIRYGGQAGLQIQGNLVTIEGAAVNIPKVSINNLTASMLYVGGITTSGESGMTTQVGITTSSGTHRTLQFTNGILTDNDV